LAVSELVDIRQDQEFVYPPDANFARLVCLDGLAQIAARSDADDQKRLAGKHMIDALVRNLQSEYAYVLREYEKLKKQYLEPI
jgi:hypothetical protein